MGDSGNDEFLPQQFDLNVYFRFLGNKLDGSYFAFFKYNSVVLKDRPAQETSGKSKYDLTESFRLTCDPTLLNVDSAEFSKLRPIPLTPEEHNIYREFIEKGDTALIKTRSQKPCAGVLEAGG